MARVLLAPVVDQDLLVRAERQHREAPADHAAIRRRAGWGVAAVGPARSRRPDRGVVRVRDVQPPVRCEVRIQRDPHQAAVPEVVDVRSQVRVGVRSLIVEAAEHLDQPALERHEDAAVRGELDRHRVVEAGPDDVLLEAADLEVTCRGGPRRAEHQAVRRTAGLARRSIGRDRLRIDGQRRSGHRAQDEGEHDQQGWNAAARRAGQGTGPRAQTARSRHWLDAAPGNRGMVAARQRLRLVLRCWRRTPAPSTEEAPTNAARTAPDLSPANRSGPSDRCAEATRRRAMLGSPEWSSADASPAAPRSVRSPCCWPDALRRRRRAARPR